MLKPKFLNPTMIGCIAVLIWGLALPLIRIMEEQIGILALMGVVFSSIGILGLIKQRIVGQMLPEQAVFRHPFLYVRWFCFIVHEVTVVTAILICRSQHVPIVILINYLWPTAIIISSVLFAGLKIEKWSIFIAGSIIVLASLAIETLGPGLVNSHIFENANDRLAYLLAFMSAVSYGLYCAFTRRFGEETGGGKMIPLFQMTLALALPLSFIPGWSSWNHLSWGWMGVVAFWCAAQFVAYQTWDFGTRRGNVVILSLFADFIPWISLLSAHLVIGVHIGRWTVISALALVCGAMITRYGTQQKRMLPQEEPPVA